MIEDELTIRWSKEEGIIQMHNKDDTEEVLQISDKGLTVKVPEDFFEKQQDKDHREMTFSKTEMEHMFFMVYAKGMMDKGDTPIETAKTLGYDLDEEESG